MRAANPSKIQRFSAPLLRALYVVPRRRVNVGRWVPSGRTLHLVDIENLMGGPRQGYRAMEAATLAYKDAVTVGPCDHVIVGCNPALMIDVYRAWPHSRIAAMGGPDGADRALLGNLRDARAVARRYHRVIVGSGDGIFGEIAAEIAGLGVPVGVVSQRQSLSYVLARAATFLRYLPDGVATGEAA